MVTLPELDSYSDSTRERFSNYSSVYALYLKHLDRPANNLSDEIRKAKHRHWLKCALASFTEAETTENICRYWSQETEELLKRAWDHCVPDSDQVALLAFGKLGSFELNLSSDIDIVFVKENGCQIENLQASIQHFIKLVGENTSFGFAYRVDTNLRPGGNQSPLVPSKQNFYNFYDEYLEAWHRLSFIRMRPLFKKNKLSEDILSYCQKRCFPRRLDFSVIDEIKSIRSKINFQWRKAHEPFDIKIHPGGIRDIELYIHSLQVIYGGRNPVARIAMISPALKALVEVGVLKESDAEVLHEHYWRLRKLENMIHIRDDQHTYLAVAKTLAAIDSPELSEAALLKIFDSTEKRLGDFFVPPEAPNEKAILDEKGFSAESRRAIEKIESLDSPSMKKQGVHGLKRQILQRYIGHVQEIALDVDLSIQIFQDFIFAIKSKTSVFHLLARNPALLENLAWLFSISPYVGQILCRRPELIDSFALGQVVIQSDDDTETLWENLVDYKLLGQLVAIIYLIKSKDTQKYFHQLSEQADFIVSQLQQHLNKSANNRDIEVLCLGKWSGRELGIQSDLDFVFLTEGLPTPEQVKLARRMITLLTNRSNAGRLYDIDLRLKPNESAGPLILEKERFFKFIRSEAQPWQKQAYLRSRLINENNFYFTKHFNDLRISVEESKKLEELHGKILTHPSERMIDVKTCRGGLIDTEFSIQRHVLLQSVAPKNSSTQELLKCCNQAEVWSQTVLQNYDFLRMFEQIFQICNASSSTKVSIKNHNLERVSKILNSPDVFEKLRVTVLAQSELLKSLA